MRTLLLLAFAAAPLAAQTPPQTLFPGLTGQVLRDAIVATYALSSAPSDDAGKDLLYSVIDREVRGGQPGASGLYTDFFVPFDCVPSCDPSQDVFNDGDGLNQEHVWPRGQGADSGLFERDLHHLFPSKVNVNADRGDLPFGESPDAQTTAWYYLALQQPMAPPLATRDLWSERLGATLFEPREGRKGDVARAILYAYALYGPDGTGQADPSFWAQMRPVLLGWHRADPATAEDRGRSDRVAAYETTVSGALAVNPFVVDSSLAARAFYPETLPTTPAVAVSAVVTSGAVVPSTGGPSCFAVTVSNGEPGVQTVDVWYTAAGPEAALLVTRFLRAVTLFPGQSLTGSFCQPVPGAIPDGSYTATFAVGDFDGPTAYGTDAVQIVKGDLSAAPAPRHAAGAPPDTTTAARYFPLAVGNVWEYRGYTDYGYRYDSILERHHVLSGAAGQPGRFVVETRTQRQWGPEPGQTSTSTSTATWHFDPITAQGYTDGSPATHCLDAPFGPDYPCGTRVYDVGGGYGQTVSVGASTLTTTVKSFDYEPALPQGFYHEETRYAAGLGETYFYAVQADGADQERTELTLLYALIGGEEYGAPVFPVAAEGLPAEAPALALRLAPNPSSGRATVTYALAAFGPVRLSVYDVLGREVAVLVDGPVAAGTHTAPFDAGALASGVYVVRLESGGAMYTQRLTLAR